LSSALAGVLAASSAKAEVSKPFGGVTLVKHGDSALVIADLCAPGVSVRTTKYDERKRTPESWANLVGAEVAINADFFDFPAATLVDGRARGAGQDWPAGKHLVGLTTRGEDRHYWQFGPLLGAEPIEPTSAPPASPKAAPHIVGGHNVLIRHGKSLAPNFDGDGVLKSEARRTAIATNQDRSRLYLFTIDTPVTGTGLTDALLSHAKEGGAPDIDFASNLDGGGSTQMFVKGQGQIVSSGREVANHVGIMANGSGPAATCPGKRPVGHLDDADCDKVVGWALDPDDPLKPLDVLLAYDGVFPDPKMRASDTVADRERPDLQKPFGTTQHGFVALPPLALFDGKEHPVWAIAKDSKGGRPSVVGGSPQSITCSASPPPSVRRHIVDRPTFEAWKLDAFVDQLGLSDGALAKYAEESKITEPPVLVRVADGKGFYVIDGNRRRRVVDDASLRAWRFDTKKATPRTAAELLALASGPALRSRPMLAKATGPAIYMLDALPTESDPSDPLLDPSGGGGGTGGGEGPGKGSPAGGGGDAGGAEEGCRAAPHRSGAPGLAFGLGALAFVAFARSLRRRAVRTRRGPS
jgi:phosphodiester glycosidase